MRRLLLALSLAPLLVFPAAAEEAGFEAAQSVIERQLDAFLADDGAAAYSFAAPSIKRMYPTVESFMAMVRNGYPMVHRSRNFAFGRAERLDDTRVIQQVLIRGADGKDYEAVYTLELQPDGTYAITGVSLRESNALST